MFDFFKKPVAETPKKEAPGIVGVKINGITINYDFSYHKLYDIYEKNPIIGAAINKKSKAIGTKGWELRKKTDKKEIEYNNDFREMLKYGTTKTPEAFFYRLERDKEITGNAYVYIVRDKNNNPVGLQVLDPRYITPISDKFGVILGYVQGINGKTEVYLPDEVKHYIMGSALDNETVGTSKLKSLFLDAEADEEARKSNLAFFRNNQTPSSIIVLEDDFMIDDAVKLNAKIKELFESGHFQGGENKHRSAVIKGIKEVIKIQDKINDAEFLELRKFHIDIVCAVLEVPKSILGFTENTNYSNGETQYGDVYLDVIESNELAFASFLNDVLREFDNDYEFVFLQDNLRKLSKKTDIAERLYKAQLLSRNEARELIQYQEIDKGDEFYAEKTTDTKTDDNESEKK